MPGLFHRRVPVAPLWRLCAASLSDLGRLQQLAVLLVLRPAFIDAMATHASLHLDKQTLVLLVPARATRLRVRDFWDLFYHEFPGWEFC